MGIITSIKSKLLGKLFAEWVTSEEDVEALKSINSFIQTRIEELSEVNSGEGDGRVRGFAQWSTYNKEDEETPNK